MGDGGGLRAGMEIQTSSGAKMCVLIREVQRHSRSIARSSLESYDWKTGDQSSAVTGPSGKTHWLELENLSSGWMDLFFVCLVMMCMLKTSIIKTVRIYLYVFPNGQWKHVVNRGSWGKLMWHILWTHTIALSPTHWNLSHYIIVFYIVIVVKPK